MCTCAMCVGAMCVGAMYIPLIFQDLFKADQASYTSIKQSRTAASHYTVPLTSQLP